MKSILHLYLISGCKLFEFQCDNARCISGSKVCDDFPDCVDNTDENMCDQDNSHEFTMRLSLYDVSEDTTEESVTVEQE